MTTALADLADQLGQLLDLTHPPVAISFDACAPDPGRADTPAQPAGCCFWEPAQRARLTTTAADHAPCSVGSYTHGLISLERAAANEDTAALLASGWVTKADLAATPRLAFTPQTIRYEPLADASHADVVLIRLTPPGLMTLHDALPALALVGKPQCQIVPLAHVGRPAVSPGCAVSRVRTGLPEAELTCAIPADELPILVDRLRQAVAAENAVTEYAAAHLPPMEPYLAERR